VNNQQSQEQQDPKPTIYLDCLKPNQCLARKICDKKKQQRKIAGRPRAPGVGKGKELGAKPFDQGSRR
jgi:hypothetical protein